MVRTLTGAALAAVLLATPALADGKIYVQLPDLSAYQGQRAEDFLRQVVLANVVSSNCPGFEVTDEEWSLLTDSADILARKNLRLSVTDYDDIYYAPAFAALDRADTCAAEGPNVQEVLGELVTLGGSTDALPDQDAAYVEWRALQDALDAAPTKKSKSK